MQNVIVIDGQRYRPITLTTLAHDFYLMKQVRATGILDCTPMQGESAEEFALRLLYAVVEHGAPFELLGALLLPEGIPDEKWSIDQAESTAAVLRQISDPEDKAAVQRILIAVITDFFREGLRSSILSPTASKAIVQPEKGEPGASPIAPNS
jgi:hypothetical protein